MIVGEEREKLALGSNGRDQNLSGLVEKVISVHVAERDVLLASASVKGLYFEVLENKLHSIVPERKSQKRLTADFPPSHVAYSCQ